MKKIISTILICTMLLTMYIPTCAAESNDYHSTWLAVNERYGMNMPLYSVDKNISLKEFEEKAIEIVSSERELQDYLSSIEDNSSDQSAVVQSGRATISSKAVEKTYTKTKPTWNLPKSYSIRAKYTVVNKKIKKVKSSSIIASKSAINGGQYLTDISSAKYSFLDNSRTVGVKYTAKVHYGGVIGTKTTLYAEFSA